MTPKARVLTPADIPAAMRIKQAAGWNQTEADWRNLLSLAPDTCFGIDCEGALAATTTAVIYGQTLAWIGMVLTDPDHRRKGLARQLMEHAIENLTARQVAWIKLDATEMGAPLYRALGFEEDGLVERWRGLAARMNGGSWSAEFTELDRAAFGADRGDLVQSLVPHGVFVMPGSGYAMSRPGSQASYLGPMVSRSPQAARQLLMRAAGPPETTFWDLLPGNAESVHLARDRGFEPVRRLIRMVRRGAPGAPPLEHDDSQIFAIAGFEYG